MPEHGQAIRAALVVLFIVVGMCRPVDAQAVTAQELGEYQLTAPVFEKFAHATRLVMTATRADPRFIDSPLFTHDILVAGDAPRMAADLQRRLDHDPALAGALFAADMHARDYSKFALALFAARLAHGFVKSGVLRAVPAGVARHNVAFVTEHEDRVAALLKSIGVEN